ncbi:uncharacterized protein LOC113287423 [Papaver somniferum]|uniref:uncharacterized protein LOC113287423 n=1 Tax=Papaver somniferum TaxID=3469 RepID=UPI000E700CE7|nr:uncharacterized protein LOC113287423 [Papaver somniferum]XP_026391978.1 uncharacterized protein LOC113287423 [Papaver somniferum]XP_026391982.1 uncharacterized protein LOC113287423 [Papaver somniferum]
MSLEASLRRHALEIEHRLSKLSIQGCSKQSIMPSTSDTKDGSCSEAKTETPSCKTNVPEVTINQKGCTSNGGKKSSNDDIKTLLSIHLDDQKLCLVYETKSSVNRKGTSKLKKNSLVQLQHTLDLILKGVNDIRMTKPIGFRTYPVYVTRKVSSMSPPNSREQNRRLNKHRLKENRMMVSENNVAPVEKGSSNERRKIDEMGDNLKKIIERYKEFVNKMSFSSNLNSSGKNSNYVSYFDDSKFYDNFSQKGRSLSSHRRKKRLDRKHKSLDELVAHTCAN